MATDPSPLGLYEGVPNEQYQRSPGCSKSMLDLVHQSPALLEWSQKAPVDEEADKAVDLGNAFEAALLEPERFDAEYITAPNVDRRTNAGKAEYREFLEDAEGKHVLSYEQARQILLMVRSTWAHPMAARVLKASHVVQGSYYWIDPVTEELCRCRPDLLCRDVPLVADVKVSADARTMRRSMAEHRWAVQDSMYSSGLSEHYAGVTPNFIFLCVHSNRSAGRYEVHTLEFDEESKNAGALEFRADLEKYSEVRRKGDFTSVEPLRLPGWALASAESL